MVSRYFETGIAREVKGDKSFVMVADKEAERVIIARIKKHFPDHSILSGSSGISSPSFISPSAFHGVFENGVAPKSSRCLIFFRLLFDAIDDTKIKEL